VLLYASCTVEARSDFTHGLSRLAVTSRPSLKASAPVIVHQLDAVPSSWTEARTRQALVYIRFAASSGESRCTDALVTAHPVDTSSAVDARSAEAVVVVDLAQKTFGSRRTGATERVDEVVACAAVLTRASRTVVHIELAIWTLQQSVMKVSK